MSDLIERANRKYGVEFLHRGVATFDVRIKHPIVADLLAELARLTAEVERLRGENEGLKVWIREEGEFADTCTFAILHEICKCCTCPRKDHGAIKEAGNG